MRVVVNYYAALREKRGLAKEELQTNAITLSELFAELSVAHGFTLPPSLVRPAVRGEFREMSDALQDGDEIVYIPPVAGG